MKKEAAEITKRLPVAKVEHERQLKQEKDKVAGMKAEEEKRQQEIKVIQQQPVVVVNVGPQIVI